MIHVLIRYELLLLYGYRLQHGALRLFIVLGQRHACSSKTSQSQDGPCLLVAYTYLLTLDVANLFQGMPIIPNFGKLVCQRPYAASRN